MKKRRLFLIGAGDMAREVESWIALDDAFREQWDVAGFLDLDFKTIEKYPTDYKVLGVPETFEFEKDDAVLMCIAGPQIKKKIVQALNDKVEFVSFISSYAIIGKYTHIGKGVIVCPNCIISTNCKIEDYVTVNCGSIIGHDALVRKYSSLMPHVDLAGHVEIGESCFLGTKSVVIAQKTIVSKTVLGAGSVVVRSLKKAGTYFGNPALVLEY